MTPFKLDQRPARPLTSREISKIIGGMLGGIAKCGVPMDDVRRTLNAITSVMMGDSPVVSSPQSHSDTSWAAALAGTIGGLASWCRKVEVLTALRWLLARWDDLASAWDEID